MTAHRFPPDVLFSEGPASEFARELELFGQFVGSWDLDVVYYEPAGERRVSAEWHFAWALNGRAIQDVWISPSRRDRESGDGTEVDWGTMLRFFDPRIEGWRCTWIGPVKGLVLEFVAKRVGAEIVLEGTSEDGVTRRWIFSEIRGETFRWRAEESLGGESEWELVQEMSARRQSSAA